MHVRLGDLGRSARSDRSHDRALLDHRIAGDSERSQVHERDGEPVPCLNRDGFATRRYRARKGDGAPGRSEHRYTRLAGDVDPPVLTGRIRVRGIEDEWL